MPHFSYKAKKGPKEIVSGVMEAQTAEEAIDALSDSGLLPITVTEIKAGVSPKEAASELSSPAAGSKTSLFSRVKSSEITLFGRQLASLLKAGVPILRALSIISDQSANPRFKKILSQVYEEVKDGSPLSSVLAKYPKFFPPIYIAMARTGEDSGTLQEVLTRISDYRKKQEEVFSRVRTAMAYPALMAITGAGTIIFMLAFVIPKLTSLFSSMGEHLPLPTRILMASSAVFQNRWLLAAAAFGAAAAVLLFRFQGKKMHVLWSHLSLKIPFVKDFVMKVEIARFARTFELLMKSGIPVFRAIEITAPVLDNVVLRNEIARKHDEIAGGGSLGQGLKQAKVFPLFMTNLVSVGEESGKRDEAMGEIADYYEQQTDEAIRIMTSLLEPLMILGMGD